MSKLRMTWTLLLIVAVLLTACGGQTSVLESPLVTPAAATGEQEAPVESLRIGLLPILDVIPVHIAQQNGYFDQVGLKVELIAVKSAQERDTLMQTPDDGGSLTCSAAVKPGAAVKVVQVAHKIHCRSSASGCAADQLAGRPGRGKSASRKTV